jgi:enolase
MPQITSLCAREILDSRGNPTLEVDVFCDAGAFGHAAVPSGASTGKHEAMELREDDPKRFGGRGVLGAVAVVNDLIGPAVEGLDVLDQRGIDAAMLEMDGTATKSKLGANSVLGVSLACAVAAADGLEQPLFRYLGGPNAHVLPVPFMNVINGGAHANNELELQEFMIVPVGAASWSEALRWGSEVFHALKATIHDAGMSTAVGDEGGFAPSIGTAREAIEMILRSVEKAGYEPGPEISVALDPAATEIYSSDSARYRLEGGDQTSDDMIGFFADLLESFPIVSIEDPLAEDDWAGWTTLTAALGDSVQLVGDDVFVTNPERLERGIREHAANAILVKPKSAASSTSIDAPQK